MEKSNENLITSVVDFLKEIKKDSKELCWFRGESNSEFTSALTPSSYRELVKVIKSIKSINLTHTSKQIKEMERNLDADFFRKGHQYLKELEIEDNLLNRYFIMQHYGIPTRLLDWTENALVALFFAVQSCSPEHNSCVYMLEPYKLNNFTVNKIIGNENDFNKIPTVIKIKKKQDLINTENELRVTELYRRYLLMDFENTIQYYPLAIMPPYLEKRMLMQSSCFTLFGNMITGLSKDSENSKFISKLVIEKSKKLQILQELDQLGINENSIFCDLEGLSKYLKRKYLNCYSNAQLEMLPNVLKEIQNS